MTVRSGTEGFTLVETLVSLSILALLSVMLAAGAHFARMKLGRLEALNSGAAIEAAQGLLRERLQRSYPLADTFTAPPNIRFDGRADQVAFVAPALDAKAPDALQNYRLSVATDGTLQLMAVSDLANEPGGSAGRLSLLRGVTGLDIAYFGAGALNRPPGWNLQWRQQSVLPQAVRIRVTFAPGDTRFWPDLIIHPAATVDSACAIEVNTGACKGRA